MSGFLDSIVQLSTHEASKALMKHAQDATTAAPTAAGVPIPFWIAQVLGTLFGLMCFAMAGASKLFPFHPMHGDMKFGAGLWEATFGLHRDVIRIAIGLAHFCAGGGLLVGLWGGFFGAFDPATQTTIDALIICAGLGEITLGVGMLIFHMVAEGSPGMGVPWLVVWPTITACRLQVTPLDGFVGKDRQLIVGFAGVCVVSLVAMIVMRLVAGKTKEEIQAMLPPKDTPAAE